MIKNSLKYCIGYFCFLGIFAFVIPSMADVVYLQNTAGNTRDTIPAYKHLGLSCVSVSHLCNSLGIEWQWDRFSERFELTDGDITISLIQNNTFYQVNDSVFQLPYPPVRSGGNLYLSAGDAVGVFSRLTGRSIAWSESKEQITITEKDAVKKAPEKVEKPVVSTVKPDTIVKPVAEGKTAAPETVSVPDVKEQKQEIKTVVIDPGHGGRDPGAIGQNGVKEKDVVLAIGLALRDELRKRKDLRIFMTRSTDKFIPLKKRTEFANEKKADIFISVHANSISGSKKRKSYTKGYKIYFLSQAKNEDDKLAAMIENSVIELEEDTEKGDYLQQILTDMANNEFLTESQDISILIVESFAKSLTKIKKLHTGVGQANFWVLNGAYMPSVLVEACFISNPGEEKLLSNKKFQKELGVAIGDAVIQFKDKYEAGL